MIDPTARQRPVEGHDTDRPGVGWLGAGVIGRGNIDPADSAPVHRVARYAIPAVRNVDLTEASREVAGQSRLCHLPCITGEQFQSGTAAFPAGARQMKAVAADEILVIDGHNCRRRGIRLFRTRAGGRGYCSCGRRCRRNVVPCCPSLVIGTAEIEHHGNGKHGHSGYVNSGAG